jgi:hypothetical protein
VREPSEAEADPLDPLDQVVHGYLESLGARAG